MKLPDRVRKTVEPFENEFLSLLAPMLAPRDRPAAHGRAGGASQATSSKKPKSATKAAAAAPKKVAKKPSSAASFVIPAPPPLTRKESLQADQLFRRGSQTHKWQFVDDKGHWSDYDGDASREVERAYSNWIMNPHIDVRSVKSGTWEYMVDFNLMTQQNIKHAAHKLRQIRRVPL